MSSNGTHSVNDLDPFNDHHVRGFQPLDALSQLKLGPNVTSINWSKDECINDAVVYALSTQEFTPDEDNVNIDGILSKTSTSLPKLYRYITCCLVCGPVTSIDLEDLWLQVIQSYTKAAHMTMLNLVELRTLDLSACIYLTDNGIKYLCDIIRKCPKLEYVNLGLLPNVTHHSVQMLGDACAKECQIILNSSGVEYSVTSDLLMVSTLTCACLNTHPNKAKLGRRLLIIRESELQLSLTSQFIPDKGPTKSLSISSQSGITEIADTHTWLDRFTGRPWPQIVLAYDSSLTSDKAGQFVFSTLSQILANQPPSYHTYCGPKIVIACVGATDDSVKPSLNMLKSSFANIDNMTAKVSDFIQKWQSKLSTCDQTTQVQYALAIKIRESFNELLITLNKNVSFVACNERDFSELKRAVLANHELDQQSSPHLYVRSEITDSLLNAIKLAAKKCVIRASELPGNGALKRAELRRLQDLGECIFLDIGDLPLVITNVTWFVHVLNEVTQAEEIIDENLAPCCAGHKGCTDKSFYSAIRLEENFIDYEVQQYLLNILDLIGPVVKVACERNSHEQPLFYLLNTVNMKPPIPLEHYYVEDRSKQSYLLSKRVTVHLSHSALPNVLIRVQAMVGNFAKFESLWSNGYVSHSGAVEIIVFLKDNRSEIVVEGLVMTPPEPCSDQEKNYVKRHLWACINIHLDVVEYVLRSGMILYRMDKPEHATNYSICAHHVWEQPTQSAAEIQTKMTVCTLCQNCTNRGRYCQQNGLRSNLLQTPFRECGCQTTTTGCWDCGICRRCVRLTWAIKSSLRPCQGNWQSFTFRQGNMFLLPTAMNMGFDEVTITTDMPTGPYITLQNIENRENIQIFPGLPKRPQKTYDTVDPASFVGNQTWKLGDSLRIRLKYHQPSDIVLREKEPNQLFNTHILRRMSLWQKEGILCYTGSMRGALVGLCASKFPITRDHNKFGIKILDNGAESMVAIGIVPKFYSDDAQPGWREKSIGYHGDDGGFYLSAGQPRVNWKPWKVGDVIYCGVDFNDDDTKSVYFCHNGDKKYAITGTDRLPDEFHAAVGMHSPAEQCQLLYSSVWRAEENTVMDPKYFHDADTIDVGGILISPARCLTMDKLTAGVKDKKASCIFIKNTTEQKKAVSVSTFHASVKEKLFDIGMRKNCKVGAAANVLDPGELTLALCVMAGNTQDKDVSESTFVVRWLDVRSADEVSTFVRDQSKTDPKQTRRLRFEFKGESSKTNQGIQPVAEGSPPSDSHQLEIFKNDEMVTNYWIPKNTYHLQLIFPEFNEQNYRNIPILVQMPKLPTYDLPDEFLPGMILEFRSNKSQTTVGASGDGLFEAGVIKQLKDNGVLVIQPKYQPDPEMDRELVEFDKESTDIRPVAREFKNIRFLMGLEPADLWNVAYGTLFTEKQMNDEIKKNLWMSCARRGTKCIACPWLNTVQEARLAYQVCEAFLPTVMTSVDPVTLCLPLPRDLTQENVQYPAAMAIMNTGEMNLHPLCYPVRISQLRSTAHIAGHGGLAPIVPHLLDGTGYPLQLEANDLDFIWRQSLSTAWCFVTMGAHEIYLEPQVLVKGCSKDYHLVCRGLNSILYQYASVTCLLTPESGVLSDKPNKRVPIHGAWDSIRQAYVPVAHNALDHHDKLVKINLETLQECICAAHFYASDLKPEWQYRPELFKPYEKLLTVVTMNVKDRKTLDSEMLQNLPNAEMLFIIQGNKLESIPETLNSCQKLVKLVIQDTILKTVPTELNLTRLSSLTLVSCRLTRVPEVICVMEQLKDLDLSYNEITSLPAEFVKLQNLTTLRLNGVPWFGDQAHAGSMIAKDWYNDAEHSLKQNRKILGEKETDRIWTRCDLDNNNMLDNTETPDLNAQLFYLVARFGLDYEDGDEDGGFPLEVCELKKLERLYLSYQAIRFVPKQIENLTNLKRLALDNNPLLESLPGGFYNLKNLSKIRLHQCPSLKTPPIEVASRGMDAVFAYLKYLSADFTECRRTKLMLVGLGGAGKTSLLRALTSGKRKIKPTVGEDITNGIDIGSWTVQGQDGVQVLFSTWDFAGQTVYYNTHQFFLSKRAVYLLLWTTRLGFEHAGLEFWLSSISCHAPKTPIFIVGTHCDQVPKADVPEKELVARYPQIAGFHFVSSISGQGIAELETRLTEVALQQPYMGEQIPGVWLELEQKIIANRKQSRVMKYEDVAKISLDVGIYGENDTKGAISFLHDLGTIQYFDSEFLRDNVVIDPQWIVDVMSSVVSVKDSPIKDGIFRHSDIEKVWSGNDQVKLYQWLLRLTEKFDLTFPVPDMDANIVPCLLPHTEPSIQWPDVTDENVHECKVIYRFNYLPAGLFNRAQVRLFEFSSSKGIWKHGSLLKKNGHLALVRQNGERELIVKVQGPQPQNICFLVHEVFENLINESFNGVQYELFLPCPYCTQLEATREPDLFPASLIHYAINRRAPYLQCRKYFHTISMSELQAIVPPDSGSDFDAQMNKSIHMLRTLREDLSTDIFLSFCDKDVPETGITPNKIRSDLEKLGYKVWYSEERKSAQELAICLNDSKLMLVFMSNEYESDKTLSDLFLYGRNTLKKPYVIINYSDDASWLKAGELGSSLGMVIGAQELYIRMTKLDQYPQKFDELKKSIQMKLSTIETSDEAPVCFLSYCWANSIDSCTKDGTRKKESAIGPIDPRELKQFLHENGISCWLDIEQLGQKGLFEDICEGVKGADFMVSCISDEYTKSENCMMELRFAAYTLQKPIIFTIVGNSPELEPGEISMMRVRNYQKNHSVYMHERTQAGFDRLLQLAQDLKLDPTQRKRERPKSNKSRTKIQTIAFQEEYELLQRKFLRQIAVYKNQIPVPYPKLVVLDLSDEVAPENAKMKEKVCKTLSRRKSTMHDDVELITDRDTEAEQASSSDWRTADMCFRILCESDQGWHCCGSEITFSTTKLLRVSLLTNAAPYLFRMYTVLKQSGVVLNCFSGDKGTKYMDFIREAVGAAIAENDWSKSYKTTLETTMKHDPGRTMGDLDRCYLPSGKIRWLCKEHQEGSRVTVLSRDIAVSSNTQKLVTDDDILVRERILHRNNMAKVWIGKRDKNKRKMAARPKTGTSRVLADQQSSILANHATQARQNQQQPTSQACTIQ